MALVATIKRWLYLTLDISLFYLIFEMMPTMTIFGFVGIILCIRPGNGKRRYDVMSLIGWAHTQNDP